MASVKNHGVTTYSGSGKHSDKRSKRKRTRLAARTAAIRESRG